MPDTSARPSHTKTINLESGTTFAGFGLPKRLEDAMNFCLRDRNAIVVDCDLNARCVTEGRNCDRPVRKSMPNSVLH